MDVVFSWAYFADSRKDFLIVCRRILVFKSLDSSTLYSVLLRSSNYFKMTVSDFKN